MSNVRDNQDSKPAVRFKGFSDAWEQRKLGEHVRLITKGTTPKDKSGKGDIRFVKVENLSNGKITSFSHISRKEHEGYLKRSQLVAGDLLFSIAGTLGRVAVVDKALLPANTNQALAIIRGFQFDTEFLVAALTGHVVRKYIRKNPTVGAQPNLSLRQIAELVISSPAIDEQHKIGLFIATLNRTIALHQRKVENLQKLKKSLLQQMFVSGNDSVPKIRFAGFADAWEQRKLSSIVNRVTRKNTGLVSDLPLTISAQDGLVDQVTYFNKRVASKNMEHYLLLLNGEFAYNKSYSKDYPWGAIKRLDMYPRGALSTLYIAFKPTSVNSEFLVAYYETSNWYKQVSERAAEGARNHGLLNIAPHDFFDTRLSIPKTDDEQRNIGLFIKKLDHTIALHQRKVENLQKLKKSLLQLMFI